MTSLALNGSDAATIKADALVVGIASSGRGRKAVVVATDPKTAKKLGDLAATLASLGATGAADEVVRVPAPRGVAADVVVAVGLGAAGSYSHETLRRSAGAAARALAGTRRAVFALPTADLADLEAVATGALLGALLLHGLPRAQQAQAEVSLGRDRASRPRADRQAGARRRPSCPSDRRVGPPGA